MKATEQYFPVVLFITLIKVVLSFESVGEILCCEHSNESFWAVLFFRPVMSDVDCYLTETEQFDKIDSLQIISTYHYSTIFFHW